MKRMLMNKGTIVIVLLWRSWFCCQWGWWQLKDNKDDQNNQNPDGHGGNLQRDHIRKQRPKEGSSGWILYNEIFGALQV